MQKLLKVRQFVIGYVKEPLMVWGIFYTAIINLTFIPQIFDTVSWILTSQIYLPIFLTSFVFTYLHQMLPVYMAHKKIKMRQNQNRRTVLRIMGNRTGMNMLLLLSLTLSLSSILLSFGRLFPEAVTDYEKFTQTELTLALLGFLIIPVIVYYYSMDFELYLKKHGITHQKINPDIVVPIISLVFFIALSYVAYVSCVK
jgi:hypothetical protein